jgi:biotin synthase
MTAAEIIECAKYAVNSGLKTVVLQSGEDKYFEINDICKIVDEIKRMDVAVTLSIGELQKHEYVALKNAGADRYLLRIETSNKQLYEKLHPGMSYDNRVRCLYDLKELGYEAGTGCLIGLPGQTIEMLANDLLFFKELDADMIGMGPFIPCSGTPLEFKPGGNSDIVLRMMALVRLLLPDINIPVTTALGVKDNDGYEKGLNCGANVIMPNVGKTEYRNLYSIYPGKEEKERTNSNQCS